MVGCLRAGVYGDHSTSHSIDHSGRPGRRITITAYPSEKVKVVGQVLIEGSYATVSRLNIDGSNDLYSGHYGDPRCPTPSSASLDITGSNDIFEHNNYYQSVARLRDNGIGVGFWGTGDNTIIRYNKIHDVGGCNNYNHFIYLAHGSNVRVYQNWMWNNRHGWGVQLYPGPTNARIYSNVIDGAGSGFVISDEGTRTTTGNKVYHNVVVNSVGMTSQSGFHFSGQALVGAGPVAGSNNSFTSNDSFKNPGGIGGQPNVRMSNNIKSPPQFVNSAARNYRVKATSPLSSWGLWSGH
jgi:hypothetical protein